MIKSESSECTILSDTDSVLVGESAHHHLARSSGPWACLDVEVTDQLPEIGAGQDGRIPEGAHIVVRVFGEPVGVLWISARGRTVSPPELAEAIDATHGLVIRARLAEAGVRIEGRLPLTAIVPSRRPKFLQDQDAIHAEGAALTVVICTRNRPEGLDLTLQHLQGQSYQRLRVLVVDNAPVDERTRTMVESYRDAVVPVDYVCEPRPGLARARNLGLRSCKTELVAFLDDDETPVPDWAVEVVRGFSAAPRVDCVAGLILPRRLTTYPEKLFESWGGHAQGWRLEPHVYDGAELPRSRILFPRPPFGAGGNMAFRSEALREMGGFTEAFGAGTPVKGAEDTDIFARTLLEGRAIAYRPAATVGHLHRGSIELLKDQVYGYGSGVTAWYVHLVMQRPEVLQTLLALLPQAVVALWPARGRAAVTAGSREQLPLALRLAHLRGLVFGPVNLARSLYRESRRPAPETAKRSAQ